MDISIVNTARRPQDCSSAQEHQAAGLPQNGDEMSVLMEDIRSEPGSISHVNPPTELDRILDEILGSYMNDDIVPVQLISPALTPTERLQELLSQPFPVEIDELAGLDSQHENHYYNSIINEHMLSYLHEDVGESWEAEEEVDMQRDIYTDEIERNIEQAQLSEQYEPSNDFSDAVYAAVYHVRQWLAEPPSEARHEAIMTTVPTSDIPPPPYTRRDPSRSEAEPILLIHDRWLAEGRPQLGHWAYLALETEEARRCGDELPAYARADPLQAPPYYSV